MHQLRSLLAVPIIPLLAAALAVMPLSCGDDGPQPEVWTDVSKSDTYTGSEDKVILVDTTGNVNLTYSIDLGSSPRELYFIFTNTTMSDAGSNPVVKSVEGNGTEQDELIMSDVDTEIPSTPVIMNYEPAQGLRGTPEISEFNRNPFTNINTDENTSFLSMNILSAPEPLYASVGSTLPFYYNSSTTTINAICRHLKNANSKTLNIWVEKSLYDSSVITDTHVQNIGNKFLNDGTNDDIYEWVSNIFGEEWGSKSDKYSYLISPTNEIHVFIYDMGAHDSSMSNVIGFFWAKDNFKSSSYSNSNQKIMFYINSDFVINNIDDVYSTLAHEFQHMINFYQKNVTYGLIEGPETWLNEMCSLVAEDLVATKIQVNGPRGVSYLLGTAGPLLNTKGRLPLYNYYNYVSLTKWLTTYPEVLRSYSVNYSFGAYLARNFGGASFMQKVVQNQYTDYHAITDALNQSGFSEDFASVMRKWGAANLLSDNEFSPADYQYNKGTWFTSKVNATDPVELEYSLGSINLYNYTYSGQTGPRYYTSTIPAGKESASNVYFRVGTNLKNTVTRTISMEDNIKLTVVVKVP